MHKVDWKRNNKVEFNSFIPEMWWHETVKAMCVLILRHKHQDSRKVPIYTEYPIEIEFKEYEVRRIVDVFVQTETDTWAIEIQKKITKKWLENAVANYESAGAIFHCLDLNKVPKDFDFAIKYLIEELSLI